jgi:hypothetical protein
VVGTLAAHADNQHLRCCLRALANLEAQLMSLIEERRKEKFIIVICTVEDLRSRTSQHVTTLQASVSQAAQILSTQVQVFWRGTEVRWFADTVFLNDESKCVSDAVVLQNEACTMVHGG